jgi:hypothetical protein
VPPAVTAHSAEPGSPARWDASRRTIASPSSSRSRGRSAPPPLSFDAEVTTTNNESNLANNTHTENVSLDYSLTPITGPVQITNRHCTGQGLIGFYECTLFSGSISSHQVTLLADGSIDFGGNPTMTGVWSQALDDRLALANYSEVIFWAAG